MTPLEAREADRAGAAVGVRQIWGGRMTQAAARYGDHAPMATVCCNACRTCATTNVIALATGTAVAGAIAAVRLGRRLLGRPG